LTTISEVRVRGKDDLLRFYAGYFPFLSLLPV